MPVRQDSLPDDWHCTWIYLPSAGVWELKFIHAACPEHARLTAA